MVSALLLNQGLDDSMVKDSNIIPPTHSLKKIGIPTIKLTGVLITKPTVQYLSSDRVAVHFLITTHEDYAIYQQSITEQGASVEMPPAHHVLLLTEQSEDLTLYAALKKRTKVFVECMNVSYPLRDCQDKVFNHYRLLVVNLTILSNKTHTHKGPV